MKRKMFATAVVLVVMATPLFGAQASPPAKPAQGSAAPKADEKKQPAVATPGTAAKAAPAPPKVTSVTTAPSGSQKPATAPAKATPAVATTKATPATATKPAPIASGKPAAAAAKPEPAAAKPTPPLAKPTPAAVKTGPVALTAVQEKLQANKDLVAEVQGKLTGADVIIAAGGFKDLPEFVSTVYAAHNLGLSFDALKAKLLSGKRTGLRQAIQELRPAASAAIEAQRAQYDAVGTIRTTERAAMEAAAAKPAPAVVPAKASPANRPASVAPAKPSPSAVPAKATPSAAPAKPTPSATPAKASPSAAPKATAPGTPVKAAPKPAGSSGR